MDEHNHTIAKMKKPVIASVKGYALANGAGLIFACDLAVLQRMPHWDYRDQCWSDLHWTGCTPGTLSRPQKNP